MLGINVLNRINSTGTYGPMGLKHVEHAPLGLDKVFFYRSRKKERKPCSRPISQIWLHSLLLLSASIGKHPPTSHGKERISERLGR
jgi:hypothetical protein